MGAYQEICRCCTTSHKVEHWGVGIGNSERGCQARQCGKKGGDEENFHGDEFGGRNGGRRKKREAQGMRVDRKMNELYTARKGLEQ